jgi:hypothetical protein
MTSRIPADRPSASEVVKALRDRLGAESGRHAFDAPDRERLQRITALAVRVLRCRAAIVSLREHDRETTVAHGLDGRRLRGLDQHALTDPLVAAGAGLRFYESAAIADPDGHPMGMLCVLDDQPRTLTVDERSTLHDLAAMVLG